MMSTINWAEGRIDWIHNDHDNAEEHNGDNGDDADNNDNDEVNNNSHE